MRKRVPRACAKSQYIEGAAVRGEEVLKPLEEPAEIGRTTTVEK